MLVIPISSQLYQVLKELAQTRRMVFITGLPGVGKSLLIQQLALIAKGFGRNVHLLQYNVAREPFETEPTILKYPEVEGVTAPAIRKAVGLWAPLNEPSSV
jgi:predicted AAA+ superfamily ATPase